MLQRLVAVVVACGGVAAILAGAFGSSSGDALLIAGLILGGALSERFKVRLFGDSHVSMSVFACMTAALVGGARDAAIVAPLLAIAANLGGRVPLYKTAYNCAVYTLSALACMAAFEALDGLRTAEPVTGWMASATAAAMAYYAVNAGLVAAAIGMASGRTLAAVWREKFLWLAPHYLPLGIMVFAAEVGYRAAGAWSLLLVAAPIASTHVAMALYSTLKESSEARLAEVESRFQAVEQELARARGMSGAPGESVGSAA
jgi:hypothetical protein